MAIVTQNTIYAGINRQVAASQTRLENAQNHAATGRRVLVAADDPVAAARGTLETFGLGQLDGMQTAAHTARETLGSADAALRQTTGLMTRAQEIAVAATNLAYNATDRANFRAEVDEMRVAVLSLANARTSNSYLFAGFADENKAFDDLGVFQGDNNAAKLEVAPGLTVVSRLPGGEIFTPSTGVNVFDMLSNLSASLAANDTNGMRAAIDHSQAAIDQVTDAQATIGAHMAQIDTADMQRETAHDALSTALRDHVQVDMTKSFTELIQAQAAYQAAVAEATRILTSMSNALTT